MKLGFETIGNATLILYEDGIPVLSTDPWVSGNPYFGSWKHTHEIPELQKSNINKSKFIWISHGHPDHLDLDTIKNWDTNKFLISNHFGDRIFNDLTSIGLQVNKLKDKKWTSLSNNIEISTFADFNQDSILMVKMKDVLIIDLNDTNPRGWSKWVKETAKNFKKVFLLKLTGFGDADMINYYDENDNFIYPLAEKRIEVGKTIGHLMESFHANFFIPFSSHHKYQREDSIWANKYTANLDDYKDGFDNRKGTLLPAFISYDIDKDNFKKIQTLETNNDIISSKSFNDDWSEPLSKDDEKKLKDYFLRNELLKRQIGFIQFTVGEKEYSIDINKRKRNKGILFEVPKYSLMQTIKWNIFDDLLIGNFMKTKVIGFRGNQLYPIFNPIIPKYYDQAQITDKKELKKYFKFYKAKAPLDTLKDMLSYNSSMAARKYFKTDSKIYKTLGAIKKTGLKSVLSIISTKNKKK